MRVCVRCVMDETDKDIIFDEEGVCDHCHTYDLVTKPIWEEQLSNKIQFQQKIDSIKKSGNGTHNCILGLSGGVDSSYMLHYAVKELGLKPLVFHVDGGWNSDISTTNIANLVDRLGIDLMTEVVNWEEMRSFQLAFFRSGVPHIDLPQDHAFIATLYKYAAKSNIRCILNGGNYSTEAVRNPINWGWYGTDMKHINAIRKMFGASDMPTYPFSSVLYHRLWLRYVRGVSLFRLLDYIPYSKATAIKVLMDNYDWKPYPQKHFESRFTRFYEGYWLPTRFNIDTRKTQLSSLILSGQVTRDEAMSILERPALSQKEVDTEFRFISDKLQISVQELESYRDMPLKFYYDYPNSYRLFDMGAKFSQRIGAVGALKR